MKKMLAILLVALTLFLCACSVLGEAASMVPEVLGQSSASKTPFPSTVQSSHPSGGKTQASASPSESDPASPMPTRSSTELAPEDVINTVQTHLPIGLQFLIDQIGNLFNSLTGQAEK